MKNLLTLSLVLVTLLFATPEASAQNAHQKEVLKHADKITHQIAQKVDLDKNQIAYLKRGLYNYEIRMENRLNDSENAASKEEIDKQFKGLLKDIMSSDELQKVIQIRDELIKKKTNKAQLKGSN